MSVSAAPNWAKWKHIPHAEIWQVVVLSCGCEPEYLQSDIERGRPHWRERQFRLSTRVPEEYYDRLDVVIANLGVRIKVVVLDGNDSRWSKIELTEFAEFAEACGWQLPADFPRQAATLDTHIPTVTSAKFPDLVGPAPEFTPTDFFDDSFWNMLQVIAWVTTRAPALVHKASVRFKGQQRHFEMLNRPSGPSVSEIVSEPVNWVDVTMHALLHPTPIGGAARARDEVEREIVGSLESGRLKATGVELGKSKPVKISKADWAYLELYDDDRLGICARNKDNPNKYEHRFAGLKVARDEVLAEWRPILPEPSGAEGKDNVIAFPAGTEYWPAADLPELIAQALSRDGRGNLNDVAKHRAALVHAVQSKRLNAVSATDRLLVDQYQANAEIRVVDLLGYVQEFGISLRMKPPHWDAKAVGSVTEASHWSERELEAICFGFPPELYSDLCTLQEAGATLRAAILRACVNGQLIAQRTGSGSTLYGGEWQIQRLSAVRWAIKYGPAFPELLASANMIEIFAWQDAERRNAGRYTLKNAADEIERNTAESAEVFVEKFRRAVRAQELAVYRPGERARYIPETVREFYEEAYWDDLNNWLAHKEPRVPWKFPAPEGVNGDRLNYGQAEHIARPKPQHRHQEDEILRVLVELGYNAMALPKAKNGTAGVKKQVRERLTFTPAVFDLAWERLLKTSGINYAD